MIRVPHPPDDPTRHPGFLGYESGSGYIVAIHADWPAYPGPPGPAMALFYLCQFPRSTRSRKIDEIDWCVLFVAEDFIRNPDPFHEKNLQVAIWG